MFTRLVKFIQWIVGNIKSFFKRDPDRFLKYLLRQAEVVSEGLALLVTYMEKPSNKNAKLIRQYERDADEVRRIMLDELAHTFVTPIDREDLAVLSRDLDDVMDFAWSAVNEMDILDVQPNQYLKEMAELMKFGADELQLAVERLPDHPRVANEHALRAISINNRMEHLYATALSELFDGNSKNVDSKMLINMMKLRESYRHMFHAAQSVSKAGNSIVDIVVKFF